MSEATLVWWLVFAVRTLQVFLGSLAVACWVASADGSPRIEVVHRMLMVLIGIGLANLALLIEVVKAKGEGR